jgi:hypothetical protein
MNDAASTQDLWKVLVRARIDQAPQTLAAAQDAVFRRYLPIARTLANNQASGRRPIDLVDAERAAELGLAQAVLGWRQPDSDGFEFFARAAITSRLHRLPAAGTGASRARPSPDV